MNCLATLGLCLALASSVSAQGADFVNLDFSEPDLTGLQYDQSREAFYGVPTQVIPGWTITQNQQPVDRVWVTEGGAFRPITLNIFSQGNDPKWYVLSYDGQPAPGVRRSTTLLQTATIPQWALSLEFVWNGDKLLPSPMHVDGGRVGLSFEPLNPASYTADVSRWAGQEVTLSFEFPTGNVGYLANLRFTVPEPQTWSLALAGVAGLYWLHRRRLR